MKKLTRILYFNVALLVIVGVLVGCSDNKNKAAATGSTENKSAESTEEDTIETDENTSTSEVEETDTNDTSSVKSVNNDSNNTSSANNSDKNDKETLSQYSSKEIEYARIWLQLGPNQDLDGLYVKHIPAGTPLNPDDETSASYPEDVTLLMGGRLVDGSVTYSGNGDGTINVYNVPSRWDGQYPAGEKFYIEIIEDTKTVYVDPGDDEKIIALIKLLKDNQ